MAIQSATPPNQQDNGAVIPPTTTERTPGLLEQTARSFVNNFSSWFGSSSINSSNTPSVPTEKPQPIETRSVNADGREWTVEMRPHRDSNFVRSLLDPSQFQPNPLNAYHNVTPHFRLLVANAREISQKAGEAVNMQSLIRALDETMTVVIAETGKTAGLNIKDVNIVSRPAGTARTRNTAATEFTITIGEPLAVRFMDIIHAAAATVGMADENFMDATYFLELTFSGYSEDGSPLTMIPMNVGDSRGRWVWPVVFRDRMQITLDAAGSNYILPMAALPNLTYFDPRFRAFLDTIVVQGETLGVMLHNLGEAMTRSWEVRHGKDYVTVKFRFRTAMVNGREVNAENFNTRPANRLAHSVRLHDMKNNGDIPAAQFREGTVIVSAIEALIASTEEGERLAKDVGQIDRIDMTETRVNERGFRETCIFKVQTEVKVTSFDPVTGRYRREIIYHIIPYVSIRPILSRQQVTNAENPNVQRQMLSSIQGRGLLPKRYEYIHTGLNTEVLHCDIKFDWAWQVDLAPLAGKFRGLEAVEYGPRANPITHSGNQDTVRNTADAQRREVQRPQEVNPPANSERVSGDVRSLGTSAPPSPQVQTGPQQSSANAPQQVQRRLMYGEDLVSPSGRTRIPISLGESNNDGRQVVVGGVLGPAHRDKSTYGAILDQLYSDTDVLVLLDLEIRGDPYWLGATPLSTFVYTASQSGANGSAENIPGTVSSRSETIYKSPQGNPPQGGDSPSQNVGRGVVINHQVEQQGDLHFVFEFKYPIGIDETTGQPISRMNDVFTGIYFVQEVESVFTDGLFRQRIKASRHPLLDYARLTNATPNAPAASTSASNDSVQRTFPAASGVGITVNRTPSSNIVPTINEPPV